MTTIQLTEGQHKYYGPIVDKINSLKTEVRSIFYLAESFKQNLDTILEARNERIFKSKKYLSLARPYREEIKGYFDGQLDAFFHNNIEWVLYYGGKYVGNSKRDKEATDNMYKNPNFDNSLVAGFHVYKGTENKYN